MQLVTLSTDTPKQTAEGMSKHGARAIMLSDSDLSVTRKYGIENTAFQMKPPHVKGLPIPTTILVDAQGNVSWIDQADDYQVRSQPDRVLAALKELP